MALKKEVIFFHEEEIAQQNFIIQIVDPLFEEKDQLYIVDLPFVILLNN